MPGPDPTRLGLDVSLEHERETRLFRRARRKARERAGEIKELNIVAMMDMMTIILVFLLKSYQASTLNLNMGPDLTIPISTTQLHPQENINISISQNLLTVNDRAVLPLTAGAIPPQYKQGKQAEAFFVGPVHEALKKEVDKQKYIAQFNQSMPFSGRVNVIADRKITYRTLMEVLYTAGQAELGEYKFMVMKNE
jgi:biopolymer transport protein ExbD